ncbi:hypothetical protein [Bacillus cereus]|uniref:hypothetical protein n=1 Tax=Bacillus cereus TaxID=1396 RepID=UPI0039815765
MKKMYVAISVLLNFIFGFLFMYALLGVLVAVYSVDCLFNGCSDIVGGRMDRSYGGDSYYFDNECYSFSDNHLYEQKVSTCCEDEKKTLFPCHSPFFYSWYSF